MKESYYKSMGKRLAKVREELEINVVDMASKFNMTRGNWSKIERGEQRLSALHIYELYVNWEISPYWLITGKGNMLMIDDSPSPIISKKINSDLLSRIITAVEKSFEKRNKKVTPEAKAEIISVFYDQFIEATHTKDLINIYDYLEDTISTTLTLSDKKISDI